MPYTLAYKDRYTRVDESKIESDTSNSVAFASLPDDVSTRLMTEWTGRQFTKMLSALKTGAELMFPDEANEILWQLVKVVHQPISFGEEGDCMNFLPSAPFVVFTPQNPYNQPGLIPPNYAVPPFMVNSDFEYPAEFGYLVTDVFVQPAAINIDPIDLVTMNLPTIKISVVGSGQIELDFLSVSLGSYAILKVGSPPNILDIIMDGILDDVIIIDLNNDSISIPPESDIVTAEEVNIDAEAGVMTDVYIVFVPAIDDSFIPLRFGGGLRQIGLCGFETAGSVSGVEDVRFNVATCSFEKRVGGIWETIEGGEEWLDCVPEGGSGGGGGASLLVTTYGVDFANQDTTSTAMVKAVGTAIAHNFTKSKAIAIAEFMVFNNSASNTYAEIRVDSNQSTPANPSRRLFNSNTTVVNTGNFENIELGSQEVAIFFSAQSGTARIVGAARCVYTIIEYESIEDLFVEDVRIVGRDLQKKIGGVWITVSDSLSAIFDSIDAQISAINATNTSQQTQINTATSVNATQNGRLTVLEAEMDAVEIVQAAHDVRLDNAEARLDDIDLSIAGLIVEQATQNGRLDDLEAASGGGELGSWGGYRLRAITDINTNGAKYSSTENTYDTGTFPFAYVGWIPNAFSVVKVNVENAGRYNSMAYLRVGIVTQSLVAGAFFLARINGGEWSNIMQNSSGNWTGWLKVPQIDQYPSAGNHDLEIEIQSNNSDNEWRWKGAVWAYINVNPFDGTTSD